MKKVPYAGSVRRMLGWSGRRKPELLDRFWAVFYGFGQMLSFMVWVLVGYVILIRYEFPLPIMSFAIVLFLGGLGTYWYAIRKYESWLEDETP